MAGDLCVCNRILTHFRICPFDEVVFDCADSLLLMRFLPNVITLIK